MTTDREHELWKQFEAAAVARDNGEPKVATRLLREILDAAPAGERALLIATYQQLGYIAGSLEEPRDLVAAVTAFAKAVEISPRSELSSLGLFHALDDAGRQQEALAEALRFLSQCDSYEYRTMFVLGYEDGMAAAEQALVAEIRRELTDRLAERKSVPDDREIERFWRWFERRAPTLAKEIEVPEVIAEMDGRIWELGDLMWEVGPGVNAANMFVLSPDGAPELLPVTEKIIAMAPLVPGWELYPARQPRPVLHFTLESADGRVLQVDPRRWRYTLYRFPEGDFDLVLEQGDLEGVSEDERYAAAVIFLDGVLGEVRRLRIIREVEVVSALTDEQAARASKAEHLAAHLGSLATRTG